MRRIEVVLGLREARSNLPFAHLDTLYFHVFSTIPAEHIAMALQIISFFVVNDLEDATMRSTFHISWFLSMEVTDAEMILGYLASVVELEHDICLGPNHEIRITHASLGDFLLDKTRSKEFHIDRYRSCIEIAQICMNFLMKHEGEGLPSLSRT